MADIRRAFLGPMLDGLTHLTLDEAWSDFGPIRSDRSPSDRYRMDRLVVGGGGFGLPAYVAPSRSSSRRHGGRTFSYYKRVEARATRRNDRALVGGGVWILWTYSDKVVKVEAKDSELTTGFYSDDFQKKATVYVFDRQPVLTKVPT